MQRVDLDLGWMQFMFIVFCFFSKSRDASIGTKQNVQKWRHRSPRLNFHDLKWVSEKNYENFWISVIRLWIHRVWEVKDLFKTRQATSFFDFYNFYNFKNFSKSFHFSSIFKAVSAGIPTGPQKKFTITPIYIKLLFITHENRREIN